MKTLFLIFLLLPCFDSFSQNKVIGAILIPKQIEIPVFESPEKDTVGFLLNDSITDRLPLITVIKIRDNFAYIKAETSIIDSSSIKGWIELKNLGINPGNYEKIYLRQNPNPKSPIVDIIEDPQWGDLYNFTKKRKGWLYIKTLIDRTGMKKSGWISPEDQDANPYTTSS